jgi:glutathione peroxidase
MHQQIRKLQELYEKYKDQGFVVVAFPSSDFYNREFKTNLEIAKKYRKKHNISFPILSKVHVKGDSIDPVFDLLSSKELNGKFDAPPKWNFHKYLINEQGFLVKSIPPSKSPLNEEIIAWIEKK